MLPFAFVRTCNRLHIRRVLTEGKNAIKYHFFHHTGQLCLWWCVILLSAHHISIHAVEAACVHHVIDYLAERVTWARVITPCSVELIRPGRYKTWCGSGGDSSGTAGRLQ